VIDARDCEQNRSLESLAFEAGWELQRIEESVFVDRFSAKSNLRKQSVSSAPMHLSYTLCGRGARLEDESFILTRLCHLALQNPKAGEGRIRSGFGLEIGRAHV
jgi:hypothetical protein